jgi:hypothetical protein
MRPIGWKMLALLITITFVAVFAATIGLRLSFEYKKQRVSNAFTACLVDDAPKLEYPFRSELLSRCREAAARIDSDLADLMARCVSDDGVQVTDGYVLSPQGMSKCFGGRGW